MGVSLLFLCILAERGQVKAACPFPMNRGHLSIIYQCVYCLHQQPNIPAHTFRQNRNIMRTVCWFSRLEYVMQAIADSLWCIGSFIEYIFSIIYILLLSTILVISNLFYQFFRSLFGSLL